MFLASGKTVTFLTGDGAKFTSKNFQNNYIELHSG